MAAGSHRLQVLVVDLPCRAVPRGHQAAGLRHRRQTSSCSLGATVTSSSRSQINLAARLRSIGGSQINFAGRLTGKGGSQINLAAGLTSSGRSQMNLVATLSSSGGIHAVCSLDPQGRTQCRSVLVHELCPCVWLPVFRRTQGSDMRRVKGMDPQQPPRISVKLHKLTEPAKFAVATGPLHREAEQHSWKADQ